jgi:crotonobetainyl-CoA:carnitine CoA-transferase CaiB-like acyl-CoA transferase
MVVVDVGFMVAGPGAARILGDLGATVIKIEPPHGDVARHMLPLGNIEVLFEANNRGKQGVICDLKSEGGREVFRDIVKKADLIVTNLRPAFLEEAEITWSDIHALNPRTSLAVVTTFGFDDAESGIAGGDAVAQAESGNAFTNGEPDGTPLLAQTAPADVAVAMFAAISMLASYVETQRTGVGRFIDLSLTDVYMTMDVSIIPMVLASAGQFVPKRAGRFHPVFSPHGVFQGTGGHVVISGYGSGPNSMWPRIAEAIGHGELANADGYESDATRLLRLDYIVGLMEEWLATFPNTDEAVAVLRRHGVIAATIRSPHDAVNSERARRRFVRNVELSDGGSLDVLGLPVRIEGYEPVIGPAPLLGEDTVSVLSGLLGYDDQRIADLVASGAVGTTGGSKHGH